MTYKEFKQVYKWIISKCPDITALFGIDEKVITVTETRYTKRGNRWQEVASTTEEMTPEYYLNTVDAVPFFRNLGGHERLEKAYTKHGLIPVAVHSTRPDGKEKVVRRFKFN